MSPRAMFTALIAASLLVAAAAAPLTAQQIDNRPLTFEAVTLLATTDEAGLVTLERELLAAREKLGWEAYKDDVSLGLNGTVSGSTFAEVNTGASANLGLALEVLPQLTVTGSLVGRVGASAETDAGPYTAAVGLTLNPLADARGRDRDELAVVAAEGRIAMRSRELSLGAIGALLAAVEAHERISLLEAGLEVAERSLATAEALAERDGATVEQVFAATDAVRSAKQALESGRLGAQRSLLQLAQTVGLPSDRVRLPEWDELGLDALVAGVARGDEQIGDDPIRMTRSVAEALVALESARIALAATRTFSPSLSMEAGVSAPGPGYSVELSFAVSPASWDRDARARAEQDVGFAEAAYEATLRTKELDLRLARLELDHALANLTAARESETIARKRLTETRLRYERGYLTELDVSRSEISLEEAALSVWTAKSSVALAWYAIDLAQF